MLQPGTSTLSVYLISCTNVLYNEIFHKFQELNLGFNSMRCYVIIPIKESVP